MTPDGVRGRNLSRLLTLLHRDGPLSRAELTRRTGLNRSTIAALVGELGVLGAAYETDPAESGTVGRPSPTVHPQSRIAVLTVNPDVDAVTVGLVGLGGTIHRRERHPTTTVPTVASTVDLVRGVVDVWRSAGGLDVKCVGVGVAVPGLVSTTDGSVTLAPHLGWQDAPVAAPLASALGLEVVVVNDAFAGAVAESRYGAGRGLADLVYLNGSASGIGGGVLVGGRALRGAHGYGGELGHTVVNAAGTRCDCGRIGCLETEVAQQPLLSLLGADGGSADDLDKLLPGSTDPAVRAEVERQVEWLGVALGNFVHVFDPEAIVLGGFLGSLHTAAGDRLTDTVRRRGFAAVIRDVAIARAELGSALLTVGAAEVAFDPVLSDPSRIDCRHQALKETAILGD